MRNQPNEDDIASMIWSWRGDEIRDIGMKSEAHKRRILERRDEWRTKRGIEGENLGGRRRES